MEVEFGWGGVQTHFHVKPNSVRLKRNGKQVLVLLKLQVWARLTDLPTLVFPGMLILTT